MNEQNFVGDTQDSTEDIQYQAYVALVEDFKELIDTTVKAGKDSYKHVDLFDGKSLEESVTHTVPLDDDKAQFWLRRAWTWQTRLFGCTTTTTSFRIQSSPRSPRSLTMTIRNIKFRYSRK